VVCWDSGSLNHRRSILAPASWSAVGSEARHRFGQPDGVLRPLNLLPALESGVVDARVPSHLCHRIDSLRSPFGQHCVLSISAALRFQDASRLRSRQCVASRLRVFT
jgi:hypothetical protein